MALPDMSLDESAPLGRPVAARPLSLQVPDEIGLIPLDPPQS